MKRGDIIIKLLSYPPGKDPTPGDMIECREEPPGLDDQDVHFAEVLTVQRLDTGVEDKGDQVTWSLDLRRYADAEALLTAYARDGAPRA